MKRSLKQAGVKLFLSLVMCGMLSVGTNVKADTVVKAVPATTENKTTETTETTETAASETVE